MTKVEQRIQISRSKYIEDNIASAELRLKRKDFLKGEVVMLNYYKDPDYRSNIGVLLAIGTKNGTGEDCYKILSLGSLVQVRGVTSELPDVSQLVHGEVYIYKSPEEEWYYVYRPYDSYNRTLRLIDNGPFIFLDISTGYRWFYEDQACKREDDFIDTSHLLEILSRTFSTDLTISVWTDGGTLIDPRDTSIEIPIKINATDKSGTSVLDNCTFYYEGEEIDPKNFSIPCPTSDRRVLVDVIYEKDGIKISYTGYLDLYLGKEIYYGPVNDDWVPGETSILGDLERGLTRSGFNIYIPGISLEYKRFVLAYPKSLGYIKHIYDFSGLDYIRDYQGQEVLVNSKTYLVYLKDEAVVVSNFLQDFHFTDDTRNEGSGPGEYGDISDLISAWKNRGNAGSLITLGGDGKIPEEYYDTNVGYSFTEIEDFFSSIPESGMTEGKLYYIEDIDKLYTATSESTGVISSPETGMIYRHQDTFYAWNGENLVVFSNNISSTKIDNPTEIL